MAQMSSTKHSEMLANLDSAGAKRTDSKRLRSEAAEVLKREIPRAAAAGIPITEIAKRTNMTRKAVYDVLEQARR